MRRCAACLHGGCPGQGGGPAACGPIGSERRRIELNSRSELRLLCEIAKSMAATCSDIEIVRYVGVLRSRIRSQFVHNTDNYHETRKHGSTDLRKSVNGLLPADMVRSVGTETSTGVPHEIMKPVIYEINRISIMRNASTNSWQRHPATFSALLMREFSIC